METESEITNYAFMGEEKEENVRQFLRSGLTRCKQLCTLFACSPARVARAIFLQL